ncbi:MAG: hypothetical protein ABIP19_01075 [Dermatophilaceae bacterium]
MPLMVLASRNPLHGAALVSSGQATAYARHQPQPPVAVAVEGKLPETIDVERRDTIPQQVREVVVSAAALDLHGHRAGVGRQVVEEHHLPIVAHAYVGQNLMVRLLKDAQLTPTRSPKASMNPD